MADPWKRIGILRSHVAGLAKPDKVVPRVCQFSRREEAKRLDVVDGQAWPNVPPAVAAAPCLILDNAGARREPTPATVCARPPNPVGGVRPARLGRRAARGGAKFGYSVLLRQPRLLTEICAAQAADQGKAVFPLGAGAAAHILGPKGVSGALADAELVPSQMGLGGSIQKSFGLPSRSARCATKARPISPVWLNGKHGLAHFAVFFDHVASIAKRGRIGNRTTLIACKRVRDAYAQPDLFIAPPAKPTQEVLL